MIIEEMVRRYLGSVLDVPVYVEEPERREIPYVIVEQTSGTKDDEIRSATISFDSYADTKLDALTLNNAVINAMDNFISVENVSRSRLNTTYNATDTISKRYCYSCSYDVVFLI